jgi:hypothetical protein
VPILRKNSELHHGETDAEFSYFQPVRSQTEGRSVIGAIPGPLFRCCVQVEREWRCLCATPGATGSRKNAAIDAFIKNNRLCLGGQDQNFWTEFPMRLEGADSKVQGAHLFAVDNSLLDVVNNYGFKLWSDHCWVRCRRPAGNRCIKREITTLWRQQ